MPDRAAPQRVLVTGGAGYIGSHTVHALVDAGHAPVVLDDLSTGTTRYLPTTVPFYEGDVADGNLVGKILKQHAVDTVVHFAGSIVVPESVRDPGKYYANNTAASLALMRAVRAHGLARFVFSSTAAVYGEPAEQPVSEDAPLAPINPYGRSKLMTEWMLADVAAASALRYMALRYFNVAGADPAGRTGQTTPDATHLIKVACECAAGRRAELVIHGTDYPTPDGTCVRDFIHVSDLADAHVRAVEALGAGSPSRVLNCGYGRGYSVREVVDTLTRIAGPFTVRTGARREGDPPVIVAASERIREVLGWQPQYDDLETIIRTAFAWEKGLQSPKTVSIE